LSIDSRPEPVSCRTSLILMFIEIGEALLKISDPAKSVSLLTQAAWIELDAGETEQALTLANQALKGTESIDDDTASALNDVAEILNAGGDSARAVEVAGRALALAEANSPSGNESAGTTWRTNPALPLIWVTPSVFHAGLLDRLVGCHRVARCRLSRRGANRYRGSRRQLGRRTEIGRNLARCACGCEN
jgi:hypothetical protein